MNTQVAHHSLKWILTNVLTNTYMDLYESLYGPYKIYSKLDFTELNDDNC